MIPNCIILNNEQKEKLGKFLDYLSKNNIIKKFHETEDVSGASEFTYEIFSTGLGDSIVVKGFHHKCTLTINDDGELIKDSWEHN